MNNEANECARCNAPSGFTEDEADFMEEVPGILQTYSLDYAAVKYNAAFNTGLSVDEFHSRFDDYMCELAARSYQRIYEDEIDDRRCKSCAAKRLVEAMKRAFVSFEHYA